MAKGYRPYLPEQDFLLPPSLREWLPENHLAYFVGDVVDQLDLSPMHAVYGQELRGQPPYDPQMMTKLLLYGYLRVVKTPSCLESATCDSGLVGSGNYVNEC